MPDIEDRLKQTSERCLKAYSAWNSEKNDSKTIEELRVSIHELRKVSSRLEIDMAVSERQQSSNKALPIPTHPDSAGRSQSNPDHEDFADEGQNFSKGGNGNRSGAVRRQTRRRTPRKSEG